MTRMPVESNFDGEPVVLASAGRHGVSAEDALHAYRNAIRAWILDDGLRMRVGPSLSGQLLEVGVVIDDSGAKIIHAMVTRAKFLPRRR